MCVCVCLKQTVNTCHVDSKQMRNASPLSFLPRHVLTALQTYRYVYVLNKQVCLCVDWITNIPVETQTDDKDTCLHTTLDIRLLLSTVYKSSQTDDKDTCLYTPTRRQVPHTFRLSALRGTLGTTWACGMRVVVVGEGGREKAGVHA